MSLESGAFLTMVTLGVAGLSKFPWPTVVGGILPLLAGMLIGNLDREMREFLSRAIPVLIPFFAFALGANLDLGKVWFAGLLGLGLGVSVVIVTGILCSSLTGSRAATASPAWPRLRRRGMPWRCPRSSPVRIPPTRMRRRRRRSWLRPASS
jgi:hypothetical protein